MILTEHGNFSRKRLEWSFKTTSNSGFNGGFMNTKNEVKKKIANLVIKNVIIPITRNGKPRKNIYKGVWK